MTKQEDYLGSLDADELQEEQEFLDNHWANDMLDAPHALIAVIETKIARAVIAERNGIVNLLLNQKCEDEGCLDCDTIDFHVELIRKAQDD